MADMAACMAKGGVGSYARQGWASGDGVWEWDSRTLVSLGSQSRGGKRQLEGAESGRGMGGWVEEPDMRDKEEEAERDQQQRQRWRRSQVQEEESGAGCCRGGCAWWRGTTGGDASKGGTRGM